MFGECAHLVGCAHPSGRRPDSQIGGGERVRIPEPPHRNDLGGPRPDPRQTQEPSATQEVGKGIQQTLASLVPKGLKVVAHGSEDDSGLFLVGIIVATPVVVAASLPLLLLGQAVASPRRRGR